MIKKLFIFWDQGFDCAPDVVKKCLESWELNNLDWEIIPLDRNNLTKYVDISLEISDIKNKNINYPAFSDILRIFLIAKYGGCWVDATTYCQRPLNEWLPEYIDSGFFGFRNPTHDRLLSSWFLYGEQDNFIVKTWKKSTVEYWNNNKKMDEYFWFHYLFGDLYRKNKQFRKCWNNTKKYDSYYPHLVLKSGMYKPPSKFHMKHIHERLIPLYKLSYKICIFKYWDGCLLNYIVKKRYLNLIHIGKCGGTYVRHLFNLEQNHLNRDYPIYKKFIIWVRNPIARFVSAFWFSHNLINFDPEIKNNSLTLDNCLDPKRIIKKRLKGKTFTYKYDSLVNYFKNPNNLAESITSLDPEEKRKALELMNFEREHIFKGIGWHLFNGEFVEKNHQDILFVGSTENMESDIKQLGEKIGKVEYNPNKIRENTFPNDKHLSELAINNIINFYQNTDYKALEKLLEYNFISEQLFKQYHTYSFIKES